MALSYLGLGTNLGNKEQNLHAAIQLISTNVGEIVQQSGIYQTAAQGFESENLFLNAVILVNTELTPTQLLSKTQEIEQQLGRTEKSNGNYSDRLMDIDILLYDRLILNQLTLKIPHPLITEREFVLKPLLEIAPELLHPITGISFATYFFKLKKPLS